ncbi:MAG TPA: tetratricopeptide repeat protein [Acetobacteraceae bacterium]|nr:tetratricopeptide repeat protein [Acetobacteraceae bacterium]
MSLSAARALAEKGDLPGADAVYRDLYNAAAPDPALLIGWSRVRRQAGDQEGALKMLQAANQAGGGGAAALDLASLMLDLGRADQAAPLLRQAASQGRGTALDFEIARFEAASRRFDKAAALFRAVTKAEPRHIPARLGYARAMRALGRLPEAEAAYAALLQRAPDYGEALAELAYLHGMQRRFAEAVSLYDRLEQGGSDMSFEISQAALGMMHICDWRERARVTDYLAARVRQDKPCLLETYALLGATDDPELHRAMGERFAAAIRRAGANRAKPAPRAVRPATERLRIGYISGDFSQHATSLLLAGVIEAHDREKFEVYAYDYSPEDGSPTRARMKAAFEHFVIIEREGPVAAAERIAADGIDILVDLKGYTERTRSEIVALRPAPLQVNFLGYVGTQGDDWIDYVIADSTVLPESEWKNWREQPVWMPASYYPNDRARPTPVADIDRAAQGLPADAIVLCCFNNPFKISPEIFAVWMELLRDVPGSVLWLFEGNPFVGENLRREAAAAGVAAERLVFAKPANLEAHVARHACADIFLDTVPYGAHTTGADALWAGVPMVTCLGRSWPSRVGGSLLRAVGLPELVCESLQDYAALAKALAADPARRQALREHLLAARETAPLFDAMAFARALETAYLHMADRARRGEAPVPFKNVLF